MKISEVPGVSDLSLKEVVFLVLRMQEMLMRAESIKQQMGQEAKRYGYQELVEDIAARLPDNLKLLDFARQKGVL
jgi:hypothetical protein